MKNTTLFLIVIVIFTGIIGAYLLMQQVPSTSTLSVPIEADYGEKIVYKQDTNYTKEDYQAHCEAKGGEFQECGSQCEPGADICTTVCALTCENIGGNNTDQTKNDYKNDTFDFSLRLPGESWKVVEFDDPLSPKINAYRPSETATSALPLDHFANETHVSVYPEGIPTEGLFAQTTSISETSINTTFDASVESTVFVLEDGTSFAAMIIPQERPTSWSEAGFIWVRAKIENLETQCFRDGEPIDEMTCDPMISNDTIVRTGSVSGDVWDQVVRIVNSLELQNVVSSSNDDDPAQGGMGDVIQVTFPSDGSEITSPLTISGEARGTWYFEATAPVMLVDWDGRIIAEGYIEAQDEWMTESFVPFEGTVTFDSPYKEGDPDFMKRGAIIIQKSNPSGLPEHDAAVEIPITYSVE